MANVCQKLFLILIECHLQSLRLLQTMIQDNILLTQSNKNSAKEQENYRHQEETKKIWKQMYKDMNESQEEQLGVWLAEVAQTALSKYPFAYT